MRSMSSFKYERKDTLRMRDSRDTNYNKTIFQDMKSIMHAYTNGIGLIYRSTNPIISFVRCMCMSCIHLFTLEENADFGDRKSIDYQVTNRFSSIKGRFVNPI